MESARQLWLCFFRGLNVFGRGNILMFDLERRCRTAFRESGLPLVFVDYYRATGNVALVASGVSAHDIRKVLFAAIPKPCALVTPEVVEQARTVFNTWPVPASIPDFQWTPGVALLCDGDPTTGDVTEPQLGVFKRVTPSLVLLYRRERITGRGTLHSDRKGGWAAVSQRTGSRLGGSWTARSFDVLDTLLGQAHRKLASDDRAHPGPS